MTRDDRSDRAASALEKYRHQGGSARRPKRWRGLPGQVRRHAARLSCPLRPGRTPISRRFWPMICHWRANSAPASNHAAHTDGEAGEGKSISAIREALAVVAILSPVSVALGARVNYEWAFALGSGCALCCPSCWIWREADLHPRLQNPAVSRFQQPRRPSLASG